MDQFQKELDKKFCKCVGYSMDQSKYIGIGISDLTEITQKKIIELRIKELMFWEKEIKILKENYENDIKINFCETGKLHTRLYINRLPNNIRTAIYKALGYKYGVF